jgi:hypothetical protein
MYGIVEDQQFIEDAVASITTADGTVLYFATLQEAIEALGDNVGTIKLLADYDATLNGLGVIAVPQGTTIDLNGYTLTANYVITFHDAYILDTSAGYTGKLIVPEADRAILENELTYAGKINTELNKQLPIWTGDAYIFVDYMLYKYDVYKETTITKENGETETALEYQFQFFTPPAVMEYFADGVADNGLDFVVRLSWTDAAGNTYTEDVHFASEFAGQVLYQEDFLKLTVTNYKKFQNLTFQVMVFSGTQMVIHTAPVAYVSADASTN